MSPWQHLGGRTHSRKLLGGVGRGAPGGLLHCLHKEGRRNREIVQHHRDHVPVLLHVWLHVPHDRLSLQSGWFQSLLPRPQLHHQYVAKLIRHQSVVHPNSAPSGFSSSFLFFSLPPSSLLSRGCCYKSSVNRDPGDHVDTGQRGGTLWDNSRGDWWCHPL